MQLTTFVFAAGRTIMPKVLSIASSSSVATSASSPTSDRVYRTGILHVATVGLFGLRLWKPRYVVLTTSKFHFYTFEGGPMKLELDMSECAAKDIHVMPADCAKTSSFGAPLWRISIHAMGRRYLVAAGSEFEMNLWVQDLFEAARYRENPRADSLRQSASNLSSFFVEARDVGIGTKFRPSVRRVRHSLGCARDLEEQHGLDTSSVA
ncbi:Aste57867_21822 [Aphanomyces stellatus]|uniref:Aste57867_21822 protein n=1 Tax=Aphanomyces stellatus TaxID=120398 RepID=A0A485LII6_9STRA|nr:hypothetical protein As57867_021753 [Aphanomyces stellatus]VFT98491.1 Aste57867_21822 [Aphanomyces stellatus]